MQLKVIVRSFNNLKMRDKFLIVYLLSVFLPIVVTNSAFYIMTNNRFVEQKKNDIELVLNQTKQDFANLTDQAVGLATTLYLDMRLYSFFDRDYESPIEYIESYNQVIRQYNVSAPLYNAVRNVTFFTANPTVLAGGGVENLTEAKLDHLSEIGHPHVYIDMNSDLGKDISLSIYSALDYFHLYNTYDNYIRIDINTLALRQVF